MDERPPSDGTEPDGPGDAGRAGDTDVVPFDPSTIRDPLPQPLFSWRRLVIVGLLAVAVGCLVVAAQSGGDTARTDDQDAIVSFTPTPGSRVIRQSTIGVTLAQGYDGRLAINGTAIPEAEMEGAILPGTDAYAELDESERAKGPRLNNKEQVLYRPGPGKAVAELDTGEVQITVRYWRVADGEQSARTYTYSIYTV